MTDFEFEDIWWREEVLAYLDELGSRLTDSLRTEILARLFGDARPRRHIRLAYMRVLKYLCEVDRTPVVNFKYFRHLVRIVA